MEKKWLSVISFVKSLMVVGSLFLSIPLVANAASLPHSATGSTTTVYDESGQSLSSIGNLFKFWGGFLSKEDQDMHVGTVLMILNNAENGEIGEWHSPNGRTRGMVRVVYTYTAGNGYCRVFQSAVIKNGDTKQYQETACMQLGKKSWEFYNK